MLDNRRCNVHTAAELDKEIRDILAMDSVGRGDQISGTLHVHFSDESVKDATLLSALVDRGVKIDWHQDSTKG